MELKKPYELVAICDDIVLAHDAIGRVDIDLSVFLFSNYSPKEISGFFPIFDTMHGLRGELELSVSVNLIPTTNKPTDVLFFASAAGTYSHQQFFYFLLSVPSYVHPRCFSSVHFAI